MGNPYLNSGESLIQTTDRIGLGSLTCDLLLTNRRIILVDSTHNRSESLQIPFAAIMSLKGGWNDDGEPVITLSLTATEDTDTPNTVDLVFTQLAGEHRKEESDGWVIYLMDQIVLARQESIRSGAPVEDQKKGIQPSVRRWVAPERLEPHAKIVVPPPVPVPDIPVPAMPDLSQIPDDPALPQVAPVLHDEREEDVKDIPLVATPVTEPMLPAPDSADETINAVDFRSGEVPETARELPENIEQPTLHDEPTGPQETKTVPVTQSLQISEQNPGKEIILPAVSPDTSDTLVMAGVQEQPAVQHRDPDILVEVSGKETVPVVPLPAEIQRPEPVLWPVIPAPGYPDAVTPQATGFAKVPEKPDTKIIPETPGTPPAELSSGKPRNIAPLAIAICIIIAIIVGGILLYPPYELRNGTKTEVPVTIVTPTTIPVPTTTVVTLLKSGIWVKVESNGPFYGTVGTPGSLKMVGGSGTQVYQIQQSGGGIQVSVQKQDYTGDPLTVEIYNNGTAIARRTITAPRGVIEMLVDPGTGSPFGVATDKT